jgi:hypothetical protein
VPDDGGLNWGKSASVREIDNQPPTSEKEKEIEARRRDGEFRHSEQAAGRKGKRELKTVAVAAIACICNWPLAGPPARSP